MPRTAPRRTLLALCAIAALTGLLAPAGAVAKKKLPDIKFETLSQLKSPTSPTTDIREPKYMVVPPSGQATGAFAVQLRNVGKQPVKDFDVEVFLRRGEKKVWRAKREFSVVLPGELRTVGLSGTSKVPPGVYTLVVCADPKNEIAEKSDKNNCGSGGPLAVIPEIWKATTLGAFCQPCYRDGTVATEGQGIEFQKPFFVELIPGTSGFVYGATGTIAETTVNGVNSGSGSGTAPVSSSSFLFLSLDLSRFAFEVAPDDEHDHYDVGPGGTAAIETLRNTGPNQEPGAFTNAHDPSARSIEGSDVDAPSEDFHTVTSWKIDALVAP
jgi:hypothetical protein